MKKRIYFLFVISVLCLSGCSRGHEDINPAYVTEDSETVSESIESGSETIPMVEEYEPTEERVSDFAYLNDISDEVYKNLITELVETNIFPVSNLPADGIPCKQSYAVADIDEDGKEELLINYSGANSMAGTVYYIYDYDRTTGEVYIEHMGWPGASFYDNGYIIEEASHNHGRSNLDDFWPYQIITYDAAKDRYESLTHVDAWQKDIIPEDFPKDADKDGDGIVYYTASQSYIPTVFMDRAEYDRWCKQYNTGKLKEICWKRF